MSLGSSLARRVPRCRWLVLVLAGVVLSSCTPDDRVRDAPVDSAEAPIVSAQCPTRAKDVEGSSVPGIPSGVTPTGFEAARVLRCGIKSDDENGRTTYEVTVSEGAVTAELQAVLRLPDQELVHPDRAACTADGIVMPLFLLSDGTGRAYRPHLPFTACSKPRPELLRALDHLSLTQTDSYVLPASTPR